MSRSHQDSREPYAPLADGDTVQVKDQRASLTDMVREGRRVPVRLAGDGSLLSIGSALIGGAR